MCLPKVGSRRIRKSVRRCLNRGEKTPLPGSNGCMLRSKPSGVSPRFESFPTKTTTRSTSKFTRNWKTASHPSEPPFPAGKSGTTTRWTRIRIHPSRHRPIEAGSPWVAIFRWSNKSCEISRSVLPSSVAQAFNVWSRRLRRLQTLRESIQQRLLRTILTPLRSFPFSA